MVGQKTAPGGNPGAAMAGATGAAGAGCSPIVAQSRNPVDVALEAYSAGICVLLPLEDGSKRPDGMTPDGKWKQWQSERPPWPTLQALYSKGRTGVGYVTGSVSGSVECLEFDDRPTFEDLVLAANAEGLGDLVERIRNGCEEESPRGGIHWLTRCAEIAGNTTLAERPGPPDERGNPTKKALAQTRGEGGYIVAAPSYGKVHPTGRPYIQLRGGPSTIATITPAERAALWQLARTFDELPKPKADERPRERSNPFDTRPGDDFNTRASWRDILEPKGWRHVYSRGTTDCWQRPGKPKGEGISATTGHAGSDLFYCFSTSTPFDAERGYSKFAAHTIINHGGDFAAAARALRGQGYGAPTEAYSPTRPSTNGNGATADDAPAPTAPTKPVIFASDQNLPEVTRRCWDAIAQANTPEPRYFRHATIPSRIEADDYGAPVIRELTIDRLRCELGEMASWKARKHDKKTDVWTAEDAKPPLDVVRNVLATSDPPLPILRRLVEVPVFAPDGTLQTTPGYHPAARLFYAPAPGLRLPLLPARPTTTDLDQARALIHDLIGEFSFKGASDYAHAVALVVQPFVRDMIEGPVPNYLVEAPTPGCGKGLLVECCLSVGAGKLIGVVTETASDEELRKRLTSEFRDGREAIWLDNVAGPLSSGVFAAALTANIWRDRVLGRSEMVSLRVRNTWVTTANNPVLSLELARRSVQIRIDPMVVEQPWRRDGFKHEDLRQWATETRGDLVWAALVLIQSWVVAGQPRPDVKPLGSYEDWTRVIGGILHHAQIPGFLENMKDLQATGDTESGAWRELVASWFTTFGTEKVGVGNLYPLAMALDSFDLPGYTERAQKTAFGTSLRKIRDRVIGDYRIETAGESHRASQWRLVPIHDLFAWKSPEKVNLYEPSEPFTLPRVEENQEGPDDISSVDASAKVRKGSLGSPKHGLGVLSTEGTEPPEAIWGISPREENTKGDLPISGSVPSVPSVDEGVL